MRDISWRGVGDKAGAVHDKGTRILGREATIMPPSVPLPPPGFDQLSVNEQIDHVQSLWDRIAAAPGLVPVPKWHREVLDQRQKESEGMDAGESWDVVRERLRRKLRQL